MPGKWTLMVYMAGYNNLSPFALKDLEELREVGSTEDVQVAAFVKRQETGKTERMIVRKRGEGEQVDDLGDADSGRAQTLLDFIRWAASNVPADRYGLVVWNHGSGWQPDELDALYEEVRSRGARDGVTPRELGLRSSQKIGRSLFKESLARVLELPSVSERSIASDDGSGHSLDTIELKNVLEAATKELGGPFELLGMDACLMSNLEVAYEASDHVRYVVGSEDLEPGDGWPYAKILQALVDAPEMSGADLGRTIVEEYIASYASGSDTVTQCAVDVAAMPTFTEPFEALAAALTERATDKDDHAEIMRAQAASAGFQGDLIDVRSFCDNLLAGAVAEPVKQRAKGVLDALEPVGYVVAEGHRGATVEGCGGVTVYFPSPFDSVSEFYTDLSFAKKLGWDDFLAEYKRALRGG
ncbi:MAG TPA: clostripain-related cysteine peptidase [Thermoleophilaceae bacterium]|nr:clostripain-related cysteine peptidase [Thermoleophilaceae bacterium]